MSKFLVAALIITLILFGNNIVFASTEKDFLIYMNDWESKREIASKYLKEAKIAFKEGDELTGCATQRKASKFGIKATKSLIKAMELNGSYEGLDNLEAGLNKWRELGDFC